MVELLTAGAIKHLTVILLGSIVKYLSLNNAYKDYPDLKYYNFNKSDESFLKQILKMLFAYGLFCIPVIGTLIFLLDVGVLAITGVAAYKITDVTNDEIKKQLTSPEEIVDQIESKRQYYNSKDLTDALTIDGADKATIDEEISLAKSELGPVDYEDDSFYNRQRVNAENMHLLQDVSDMVKDPIKLYESTKDNKITGIDLIDDKLLEKLVVHMQKLDGTYEDDDSKEITKTFKLR